MFAAPGSRLWTGDQWQDFTLARTGSGPSPKPFWTDRLGVGGPSQILCSQEQTLVVHTTSTKAEASVAVTSWPQLTSLGLHYF